MPTYIPTETLGTNTVFTQILGFSGVLAELGLSDAIQRFISEKRITQPQYTIYYLQFFILFKLFSGLLMVTGIAIWTFIFVPQTALAYSMWYYLIYSFLQYPGWFNVYNASLSGYQQFNKTNYIALAGQGVNLLTRILLCYTRYLFRKYGSHFRRNNGSNDWLCSRELFITIIHVLTWCIFFPNGNS